MLEVEWAETRWNLLPERALHWPAGRAVFVADLHLGKAAAFRAAGIPAPERSTQETLWRLRRVLEQTRAERLWILGDLLHARVGRTPVVMDALRAWRRDVQHVHVTLVRGNHDAWAGDPPVELGFECVVSHCVESVASRGPVIQLVHAPDELEALAPRESSREPTDARGSPAPAHSRARAAADSGLRAARDVGRAGRYSREREARGALQICGHWHPSVRLTDRTGSSVRLRCFLFGPRRCVLPAFGAFTGAMTYRPAPDDRIFVVADGEVVEAG